MDIQFDQFNEPQVPSRFPVHSEEDKQEFILHTNLLERASLTKENVEAALYTTKVNPYVTGQMRCLSLIFDAAEEPNLIPQPKNITSLHFDSLFPWFKRLHKNVLYPFMEEGKLKLNSIDYPLESELGIYRRDNKVLGHRRMPNPFKIKELLAEAFKEIATTHYLFAQRLETPCLMEVDDWKTLEQAAYSLNLKICCIKPFEDGSNRVARLSEALFRLHWGLKIRAIKDKNKYLNDIWKMQDSLYKNLD